MRLRGSDPEPKPRTRSVPGSAGPANECADRHAVAGSVQRSQPRSHDGERRLCGRTSCPGKTGTPSWVPRPCAPWWNMADHFERLLEQHGAGEVTVALSLTGGIFLPSNGA